MFGKSLASYLFLKKSEHFKHEWFTAYNPYIVRNESFWKVFVGQSK